MSTEAPTGGPVRKSIITALLLSVFLDCLLTLGEIPFLTGLPLAITVEEIIELVVSTWIARSHFKLDWIDRLLGFIPIPGITAVSVRAIREFINRKPPSKGPRP